MRHDYVRRAVFAITALLLAAVVVFALATRDGGRATSSAPAVPSAAVTKP